LQAGTAPGDRRWRPDVEGLRAVAILLVVFTHYGLPGLEGGFIGVDVFFVISGFVITGLLLRERQSSGGTSLFDFYARRCRRILPMATLVIFAAVFATWVLINGHAANGAAIDGRWAAVFLMNHRLASPNANLLSPLATYWSLAVEEQFYIVFPLLFLGACAVGHRRSQRARVSAMVAAVFVASLTWSIANVNATQLTGYLSTFCRAWELAAGALVALATPWLKRVPGSVAGLGTWLGLAAIVIGAFTLQVETIHFPGWIALVPVLGAAMVIAGGVATPRQGAERLLGTGPFRWFGQRSYSLYLWHWPVIIVAAEVVGHNQTNFWLLKIPLGFLAVALSMLTYRFVENPIRHSRLRARPSVVAGLVTVGITVLAMTAVIAVTPPPLL
jgi:peptidoglycan/LPS O-acetylase OafA/YrhL